MFINMTFGWCSLMSTFVVPPAVFHNIRVKSRLNRQFLELQWRQWRAATQVSTGDDPIQSLPWESMIGMEDMGIGGQQLTFPVVAAGLMGVVLAGWTLMLLFIPLFALMGSQRGPAQRPLTPTEKAEIDDNFRTSTHFALVGYPFVLLTFAGATWWRHQSENRPGGAPDFLAELIPTPAINQTGRVHLAAFAWQTGERYRIVVCSQNLFDAPTRLEATLDGGLDRSPSLTCDLPTAAVSLSVMDLLLPPVTQPLPVKFLIRVSATGRGGKRVRFAQRPFLGTASRSYAFDLAAALAGHGSLGSSSADPRPGFAFLSSLGQWETLLLPWVPSDVAKNEPTGSWKNVAVGNHERPCRTADVASAILQLLRGDEPASPQSLAENQTGR
ncbi:MAG TPA: hypothetical protein VFE47_13345 [Tepidisphaeraceae bacterium]|jgi:hypothetical protein|nr:hypothetical protein [Tepidisphaeraceae bacterium]